MSSRVLVHTLQRKDVDAYEYAYVKCMNDIQYKGGKDQCKYERANFVWANNEWLDRVIRESKEQTKQEQKNNNPLPQNHRLNSTK